MKQIVVSWMYQSISYSHPHPQVTQGKDGLRTSLGIQSVLWAKWKGFVHSHWSYQKKCFPSNKHKYSYRKKHQNYILNSLLIFFLCLFLIPAFYKHEHIFISRWFYSFNLADNHFLLLYVCMFNATEINMDIFAWQLQFLKLLIITKHL